MSAAARRARAPLAPLAPRLWHVTAIPWQAVDERTRRVVFARPEERERVSRGVLDGAQAVEQVGTLAQAIGDRTAELKHLRHRHRQHNRVEDVILGVVGRVGVGGRRRARSARDARNAPFCGRGAVGARDDDALDRRDAAPERHARAARAQQRLGDRVEAGGRNPVLAAAVRAARAADARAHRQEHARALELGVERAVRAGDAIDLGHVLCAHVGAPASRVGARDAHPPADAARLLPHVNLELRRGAVQQPRDDRARHARADEQHARGRIPHSSP